MTRPNRPVEVRIGRIRLVLLAMCATAGLSCCSRSVPPYPSPADAGVYPGVLGRTDRAEQLLYATVVGARVPHGTGLYVDLLVEGPEARQYSALLGSLVQQDPTRSIRVEDDRGNALPIERPKLKWRETEIGRRDWRPLFATAPQVLDWHFAGPYWAFSDDSTDGIRTIILQTSSEICVGSRLTITLQGDWTDLPTDADLRRVGQSRLGIVASDSRTVEVTAAH